MKTNIEYLNAKEAPTPLGSYSHAIGYGDLIFVSGIASRDWQTDQVPGLVMAPDGKKVKYDIRAETQGTLENIKKILTSAGSSLEKILDVTVYLLDMKDFAAYNEVYAEYFKHHKPARTTLAAAGLPGNISIEIKVVAARG